MAYVGIPYDRVTISDDTNGDVSINVGSKSITYTSVLGNVGPYTWLYNAPRPRITQAWKIRFDCQVTAMTGGQNILWACLSSNDLGDETSFSGGGVGNSRYALWCIFNRNAAETQLRGNVRLQLWNGVANVFQQQSGTVNLSFSTRYYVTFEFDPAVGTYGTAVMTIRTTSHTGTVVDTITLTLSANGLQAMTRGAMKYTVLATSWGSSDNTKTASFDQQNVEIDGYTIFNKKASSNVG